jgi:hypothetical protein
MNAIEEVFPDVPALLCLWHVNKNVLTRARSLMPKVKDTERSTRSCTVTKDSDLCSEFMGLWYSVVGSQTDRELAISLEKLRASNPEVARYCEREWISPYKHKLVSACTNRIPHFGSVTTSRVEGSHAKIKRYIQTSRNNLYCFLRLINVMWISDVQDYTSGPECHSPGL